MTDHYAEAERLLVADYRGDESARTAYLCAQVHATLAAIPPYPTTTEDPRGAQAEIGRLKDILAGHDAVDSMPRHAPCRAEHPTNGTVVPCCLDAGHIGSHWSWTGCAGSVCEWPNPADDATVEKVAREIARGMLADRGRSSVDMQVTDTARAVLAALGGQS